MSLINDHMTIERQQQITENLHLTRQFYQEYLSDPAAFAHMPKNATIVLLPPDEPANARLTQTNLQLAAQAASEGRKVFVYAVGVRPHGHAVADVRVPWPPLPRLMVYSQDADTLTLQFDDLQPVVSVTSVHPLATAIMDPATHRLLRLVIDHFLTQAAGQAPQLIEAVATSPAELVGISRERLRSMLGANVTRDDTIWASLLRDSA